MTPELAAALAAMETRLSSQLTAAVNTLALEASFGRPAAMFYVDNEADPRNASTILCWPGGGVPLFHAPDIGYYMGKGIAGAPRVCGTGAELDGQMAFFVGMSPGATDTQKILDAIEANPAIGSAQSTPEEFVVALAEALTAGAALTEAAK